ncbi:MAG: SpoIVB peptidase S55 domain-containing protein [Aminivibrio sp.]|jgi:hypothetical protein
MKPVRIFYIALLAAILFVTAVEGAPFRPLEPSMKTASLRPGMKGYALTVVSGREITRFPVEIVSIVPRKNSPENLIMIKASGPVIAKTGGIAAGMSGSPVYINGKLIGAIGYGWNFSDHTLGLVTPLEDMASVWDWPENKITLPLVPLTAGPDKDGEDKRSEEKEEKEKEQKETKKDEGEEDDEPLLIGEMSPLFIDGVSPRKAADIASLLGKERFVPGGGGDSPVETGGAVRPGEAISVLLAWGDAVVGATGTVTAVSADGRFIGFAHPFLGRGAVNYPVARSYIHSVVPSLEAPFKVGTPLQIFGTVTQDRPQGIGGRIGYFTPSVSAELKFSDLDRKTAGEKKFRFIPDPFMGAKLSANIFTGLIDDLWGRKGQGTAVTTLTLHGKDMGQGWSRKNMFFSDKDLAADALKEAADLLDLVFLNPFSEIYPVGVALNVEFTETPRLLYIEKIEIADNSFHPGKTVEVKVTLRPYRKKQTVKTFEITIPADAAGLCEILVRGGGIDPLNQSAIAQGWQSVSSFRQMFTEMSAIETNNELIIEFNYDKVPAKGKKRDENEDPVPKEDQELLSEIKKRRLEDGTLQIYRSEYVVEGLLRKLVTVKHPGGEKEEASDGDE